MERFIAVGAFEGGIADARGAPWQAGTTGSAIAARADNFRQVVQKDQIVASFAGSCGIGFANGTIGEDGEFVTGSIAGIEPFDMAGFNAGSESGI